MKTALVIPVYNHGPRIAAVIRRAQNLGLPVIVVNDGSTDSTAEVLRMIPDIVLITHPENQGKGAALLSGFQAARDMGCNQAITLDGDGQHDPLDAPRLIQAADGHADTLVVGRRLGMRAEGNVPLSSRAGREFSNFWVWAAGGPRIRDSQSGFRLYPLPWTMELGVRSRRYQFEVEVLVRARRAGMRIVETDIGVVYQPGEERISHFRPWLDFWRNTVTFSMLLAERMARRNRA